MHYYKSVSMHLRTQRRRTQRKWRSGRKKLKRIRKATIPCRNSPPRIAWAFSNTIFAPSIRMTSSPKSRCKAITRSCMRLAQGISAKLPWNSCKPSWRCIKHRANYRKQPRKRLLVFALRQGMRHAPPAAASVHHLRGSAKNRGYQPRLYVAPAQRLDFALSNQVIPFIGSFVAEIQHAFAMPAKPCDADRQLHQLASASP